MVNSSESPVYVKFHWKTKQKKGYFTPQESANMAGINADVLLQVQINFKINAQSEFIQNYLNITLLTVLHTRIYMTPLNLKSIHLGTFSYKS